MGTDKGNDKQSVALGKEQFEQIIEDKREGDKVRYVYLLTAAYVVFAVIVFVLTIGNFKTMVMQTCLLTTLVSPAVLLMVFALSIRGKQKASERYVPPDKPTDQGEEEHGDAE